MREIKFRLICDNEIVGYEYHLVDSGINKGICIYHQEIYAYKNNIFESKYPITRGDEWFIFHDDKNQYVGLMDKNNIEIYVGDIVKWKHRDRNKKDMISQIMWNDEMAGYWQMPEMELIWGSYVEIIGNIYENKELLNNG